jgi:hypothetical protein
MSRRGLEVSLSIPVVHHENTMSLAGQEGIEPPTLGFGDRCSAN